MEHGGMIVDAFTQIAREKNIEKDELNLVIEEIFKMMIKKKYGSTDNFDVIVNLDKPAIEIYQNVVVADPVTNPVAEISIEDAQKMDPDMKVGDDYVHIIDPASFGRRLIISARQTLNQKIRDIERKLIMDEFKNRIGEIVVGEIRQINKNEIYISFERTELIMPKMEQISNERYKRGDTVRAVIKDVVDDPRGPRIVVSRAQPEFLQRLFENEVPEIYDGIIEIKAIARDPGERTKIAVFSNDKRIDAVGACVGMKGVRIQAIVKELNNEKIDIVSWSPDAEIFISRALSPAKPLRVEVDTTDKKALAVINDDEMSIAVGRFGQNINLAARLTGFQIETIKYSELSGEAHVEETEDEIVDENETPEVETIRETTVKPTVRNEAKPEAPPEVYTEASLIVEVRGISKAVAEKLLVAGFVKLGDIASIEEIKNVEGVPERAISRLAAVIDNLQPATETSSNE